ncbi:hypothetical protein, partial [Escherichia coli]|uniref:hypothetical protein n=1 Tax=Escherichia coli TaxID=562 RepID=UPI0021E9782B
MCRSNKAVAPHPTISAVPLPDATLARLIRPTNPRRRPDKAFTLHTASQYQILHAPLSQPSSWIDGTRSS